MEILKKISPQLEEFQRWRNTEKGESITLFDFAGFIATPDILCGLVALLFPDCLSHRGKFFLANHFSDSLYDSWMEKLDSVAEVQKVLNHVHISTVLQDTDISDELACQFAELLCSAWRRSLRGLELTVESGGAGYDDAYVTFYQ